MSPQNWLEGSMVMVFDLNAHLLYCNEAGYRLYDASPGPSFPPKADLRLDITRLCLRVKRQTTPPPRPEGRSNPAWVCSPVSSDAFRGRLAGTMIRSPLTQAPCILIVADEERPGPERIDPAFLKARYNLTRRELDILGVLSQGARYKEIAATLSISAHTVRDHLKNIRLKFGTDSNCGILSRMMQGLAQHGAASAAEIAVPLRSLGRLDGRSSVSPLAPRASRPHGSRSLVGYETGRNAL